MESNLVWKGTQSVGDLVALEKGSAPSMQGGILQEAKHMTKYGHGTRSETIPGAGYADPVVDENSKNFAQQKVSIL